MIYRQQYLVHWRQCQHNHKEGEECYWKVVDHMEFWYLKLSKKSFLLSHGCVTTAVWVHHMEAKKMHGDKSRLELYKNALCSSEQILKAAPYKTVVVRPLTSHLTNHSSMTNNTYWVLPDKSGQIHKRCSLLVSHTFKRLSWLTSKDLHTSSSVQTPDAV